MVGCGSIARAHAAALRLLAEDGVASLVALADPHPAGMEQVAAIAGTVERRSADRRAVIDDPDVDAVVVITPTRFHHEVILDVVGAGKPLFTEKPLAPRFDEVCDIVDVVAGARIPAQVGFQSRFHPIVRYLHDTVTSGELGPPMAYTIRDDQFWPTGEVVDGHTSWRSRVADAGGGALLEHSIHSCDIACWLFGRARRVHAVTRNIFGFEVEDMAALTIEHETGVVGNLVSIFNGVQDREERRIEVFFERGVIEATTDFVVRAPEDSLLRKGVTGPAVRIDCEELLRTMLVEEGLDPDRQFWVYQYLAHREFACALGQGRPPSPGLTDALEAHRLVEAGYRSAAAGRPVVTTDLDF
jgi:predicted dehydrogenase